MRVESDAPLFGVGLKERASVWLFGTPGQPNRINAYIIASAILCVSLAILSGLIYNHVAHLNVIPRGVSSVFITGAAVLGVILGGFCFYRTFTYKYHPYHSIAGSDTTGEAARAPSPLSENEVFTSGKAAREYLSYLRRGEYLQYYQTKGENRRVEYIVRIADHPDLQEYAYSEYDTLVKAGHVTLVTPAELEVRKAATVLETFASVAEARPYIKNLNPHEFVLVRHQQGALKVMFSDGRLERLDILEVHSKLHITPTELKARAAALS